MLLRPIDRYDHLQNPRIRCSEYPHIMGIAYANVNALLDA